MRTVFLFLFLSLLLSKVQQKKRGTCREPEGKAWILQAINNNYLGEAEPVGSIVFV